MEEVARIKGYVPELEESERTASKALTERLAEIPNLPGPDVPEGKDEGGNVEYRRSGSARNIAAPKQHF